MCTPKKHMDQSIENDMRVSVGGKDSLIVTGNQLEQIGGDFHREIKGSAVEKVGSSSDVNIGTSLTEQVEAVIR